jgi:hypothetical protein
MDRLHNAQFVLKWISQLQERAESERKKKEELQGIKTSRPLQRPLYRSTAFIYHFPQN